MAENREYVWLECADCGARNYRTERAMKPRQKPKDKPTRSMENNKLLLKKFCKVERKPTLHKESRKK
jgi:ribosomal protein L33